MTLTKKTPGYFKPNVYQMMQALNLDIEYHRAKGDSLYFYDTNGQEHEVKDMIGGFGSLFFGHNHPELVAVAQSLLASDRPFAAQGSYSSKAADLTVALRSVLQSSLQRDYLFSFCNTGTETVEASLKHARLAYAARVKAIRHNIDQALEKASMLPLQQTPELLQQAGHLLGAPAGSLNMLIDQVKRHNHHLLSAPPVRLALCKAYHGKTSGALHVTHYQGFKTDVIDSDNQVLHLEAGNNDLLTTTFSNHTVTLYTIRTTGGQATLEPVTMCAISCFIIEPIQGEGGIQILDKTYVQLARTLTHEHQVPFIFDEIQSGIGRTGTFVFAEQLGVKPDYILLSKSLGGGLSKTGVLCIAEELYDSRFDMLHSSTFAEDDHSCAIGKAALDILQHNPALMTNARDKGIYLLEGLRLILDKYPDVMADVRGAGLMIGIEFRPQHQSGSGCLRMLSELDILGFVISGHLLHEQKVRVLPCLSNSNTIRLEPSAYITTEECNAIIGKFNLLCDILSRQDIYALTRFIIHPVPALPYTGNADYRKPAIAPYTGSCSKKVAFIGHFINPQDLTSWDDGFNAFSTDEIGRFLSKIAPVTRTFCSEKKRVISATGEQVELNFIGLPMTSEMMVDGLRSRNIEGIREKLQEGVDLARELGCSTMGFGGYTSIISNNCRALKTNGVHLTTGNSFTTAIGIVSLLKKAAELEIDVPGAVFAAVGAAGNICSIFSEIIAERVHTVILTGRDGNLDPVHKTAIHIFRNNLLKPAGQTTPIGRQLLNAAAVAGISYAGMDTWTEEEWTQQYHDSRQALQNSFPIQVTADLDQLKKANIIVSASNHVKPLILPQHIGHFPVLICDIAVPADVHETVTAMPDVTVIKGGIVKLPKTPDFKIAGISLPEGTAYACMSETLLLGLENLQTSFSYGNINAAQVRQILDISKKHGFTYYQPKMQSSL